MAKRKPGERIVIGDRIAIVDSRPAQNSGMQTVRYEDGRGLLGGFEWWSWQALAQFPAAPAKEPPNDR